MNRPPTATSSSKPSVPANPIFSYLIRRTPNAFWVAEDDGRVVGFSDSFVRGSLWYLSWLFILPSYQGRDIGRTLLERTLQSWNGVEISNRASITFSVNPTSQYVCIRYGMYAREPLYYVSARASTVREGLKTPDGLSFEELNDTSKASEMLKPVDLKVVGFSLDWHHSYFFESKYRCLVFRNKADSIVGYSYIRPTGGVGPVAVTSEEFMTPSLATALKISSAQDVSEIGYYTPGSNVAAVDLALRLRMKFEPFVFMSTKLFGRWENYIFHSATLM